ncbi:hypothetical protein HCC70_06605 [Streptococcus suis]|nr:hypothetical protein [Streptococcus suis]
MSKPFNKVFYRTWEFYFALLCIVRFILSTVNRNLYFMDFIQLVLGLYVGYLAFFKPRSWIKKTWQIYLVTTFIISLVILNLFLL